jgi:CubicO group peptidase (beta-lactamase class C family)
MAFDIRTIFSGAMLVLAGYAQLQAEPSEDASTHHRDFQSEAEGIAIAVTADEVTTFGAAGRLRADGPAVDADTLFEIGSITKVFTGILLADAVRRGDATLEDSIAKHLPADLLPADSVLREVTLLDLATHTSGLPRLPGNLDEGANPLDPYAQYSTEKLYAYLKGFQKSDFESRGKMSYSNLGVGLLGHLLERISGKPYETLARETIFAPLGMKDSFVQRRPEDLPADRADRFAAGHSGGKEVPHWHLDALAGAGAIVSTARDLARFAEGHWSEKAPPELRAAMDLAAQPQRNGVGLCWLIGEAGLSHDGGTGGFRSELRVSLPDKTATVRLMNGTGPVASSESVGDFTSLSGYWEGILDAGTVKLRQVFRISESGRVFLHSLDQGGAGVPADKAILENGTLRAVFGGIGGSFEAKVEGDSLVGVWKQGGELPLTLVRTKVLPPALEEALSKRITGDVSELAGWWSGYLGGKSGLFVILEIESIGKTGDARLYSPDQTPEPFPVTSLSYADGQLKLGITSIGATFAAKSAPDAKLAGAWKQGPLPLPLTLSKSLERPSRE